MWEEESDGEPVSLLAGCHHITEQLLQTPQCVTDTHHKSFLSTAERLLIQHCSQEVVFHILLSAPVNLPLLSDKVEVESTSRSIMSSRWQRRDNTDMSNYECLSVQYFHREDTNQLFFINFQWDACIWSDCSSTSTDCTGILCWCGRYSSKRLEFHHTVTLVVYLYLKYIYIYRIWTLFFKLEFVPMPLFLLFCLEQRSE